MIFKTTMMSPVGELLLGANEEGITFVEFASEKGTIQLEKLRKKLKDEMIEGENDHLTSLKLQLDEYFKGKRTAFDLNLVLTGTPFQKQVWKALMEIPFGKTRSYKEQATAIGKPSAVRAVANANGDNLISIVIPCHRVIGSNGSLTGYGGGLDKKKWLLDLENRTV